MKNALLIATSVILAFAIGCRVTDLPLFELPKTTLLDGVEIREFPAVTYYDGAGFDPVRHRLDIYVPKDQTDFPVVVLVHGGAWLLGDNRCCGLYSSVGRYFASRGIGVVMPNYRLSPEVQHPDHIKDVARAVAWTKANIGKYGGDTKKLFLMGHSAGGHLVSLLGTDERYLQAERLSFSDIRGVISVSGVYEITPGRFEATLGGDGPLSLRLDEMSPLRGDNWPRWERLTKGAPFAIDIFGPAFGPDAKARTEASPITHVSKDSPPFLIFYAENDLPSLRGQAHTFEKAVHRVGGKANLVHVKNRNHNSIIFRAITDDDPVAISTIQRVAGNPIIGPSQTQPD